MKRIICGLFVILIFLNSCQQDWKDYYTGSDQDNSSVSGANENLLEYLKKNPEYSEFVKLLEVTKVGDELIRKQVFTVWAPTNATMPATEIAAMNDEEKVTLCRNHLNYVALYAIKLGNDKVIKTVAGKSLIIKELSSDKYSFDGRSVVKLDQKCSNGVIHELDGWLIPRKNIFECLLGAGADYSILRDSILARSDTVFKPGLSFPLGVDELGNTLYDSVFVIENSLLVGKADFRSEDNDFTFFMPDNKAIEDMYREMGDYFAASGIEFTKADSSKFFRWVLSSIIHEGKISTYAGTLESVYGYEWRAEKQIVKPGYKTYSNGYVYDVEKLHIPKFLYMTSVKAYPAYIFELPQEQQADYYQVENATSYGKTSLDGRTLFQVYGNKKDPVAIFEFKTLAKDRYGNLIEGKVLPGLYRISVSYRSYLCGNTKLSINDEVVATYNASNTKFNYTPAAISESFEIKEEWGFNMIRVKQEDVGKAGRLMMEYIVFDPSRDNY